jgi:hypothetical protein
MLTIQRTACKKYNLSSDSTTTSWAVSTLEGVELFAGTFANGAVTFTLPDEGVYLVYENVAGVGLIPVLEYYTLIEECELIACLLNLFQKLFCADSGACADCGSPEADLIRYELQKLFAGYGMFMLFVFAERVTYYGIMTIDDCRLTKLEELDKWIDDLKEVKRRCGPDDCADNSNPTTTTCSSC